MAPPLTPQSARLAASCVSFGCDCHARHGAPGKQGISINGTENRKGCTAWRNWAPFSRQDKDLRLQIFLLKRPKYRTRQAARHDARSAYQESTFARLSWLGRYGFNSSARWVCGTGNADSSSRTGARGPGSIAAMSVKARHCQSAVNAGVSASVVIAVRRRIN